MCVRTRLSEVLSEDEADSLSDGNFTTEQTQRLVILGEHLNKLNPSTSDPIT
jgi:hypothetical protein